MPFTKGKKKTGGRKHGIKNKRSEQWEQFGTYLTTGQLPKLKKELNKLEGKEYLDTMSKFIEYFKPKLSRSDNVNRNIDYDITSMPIEFKERIAKAHSDKEIFDIINEYESLSRK